MGRLLFILVLLAVSLYGVKLLRAKLDKPSKKLKKDTTKKLKIVKCLHCGLHIPEKEAIKHGDKYFCSIEHAGEHL